MILIAGAAVLLYVGRDTGLYFDEWDFVQGRREWTLDALLLPHNEHLSLVPALIYKALFELAGIESHLPYRLALLALHLAVVTLLVVYARPRVGWGLALAAGVSLLFLGTGYLDFLWPFQIGFTGSLAAGLGALLCLDRGDRRGIWGAAVLLTLGLASSSLGIPMLLATAVEVLGRADRRDRLPVLVVPAVLYGAWYAVYGVGGGVTRDNAFAATAYMADAAAAGAAALFGLGVEWGRPLLLGFVALLVARAWRFSAVPWRLVGLVTLPLAFWGLTALARADLGEPGAPRYLYPGALFLLLIAIEAAGGMRAHRRVLAAIAALLAFATVGNLDALRKGAGFLRDRATMVSGALTATELAGPRVGPDFQPEPTEAPQIRAGTYFEAVRELGSPAFGVGELRRAPQAARAAADRALIRGYDLKLAPAGEARPGLAEPAVEGAEAAATTVRGGCVRAEPLGPGAAVSVAVPRGALLIDPARRNANVAVRRWSDEFADPPLGQSAARTALVILRIPTDRGGVPWHARIALDGPVRLCGVAR